MARKTSSPKKRIDVWCDETQFKQIKANADASRLPVSDFLRKVGNGCKPKSVFDRETILELARLSADQGRLSDQLKLWLSDRSVESMRREVRDTVSEIESLQMTIGKLVLEQARRL